MTFYEELGVSPDAPSESIREAYRNLARLLHPDSQMDPVLKESAESQMKRINQMYGVLSDPEKRRRYDMELAEPMDRQAPIIIQTPPPAARFESNHHGTLVWLAATGICAVFIIWLASRETSSPAVYPLPPSTSQSGGASMPSGSGSPASGSSGSALAKAAAALLPRSTTERARDEEIVWLRGQLAIAYADKDRLLKQIAAMEAEHKYQPATVAESHQQIHNAQVASSNAQAPVPTPITAPPPDLQITVPVMPSGPVAPPAPKAGAVPVSAPGPAKTEVASNEVSEKKPQRLLWSGSWTYNNPHTENKNKALFPPEFIEANLSEDNGHIRGQYHARFKVPNRKISPDVDFRFEGKVSGTAGQFYWTGAGGAKGKVQLRFVSENAIEVVWAATNLGSSMGLASGTAVLSKKN